MKIFFWIIQKQVEGWLRFLSVFYIFSIILAAVVFHEETTKFVYFDWTMSILTRCNISTAMVKR